VNHLVILEKVRRQREQEIEVAPGKHVTVRRPPEAEMLSLRGGVTVDHVARYTVGWKGFTEADVLTSGASDEMEFHPDLWREVVADRLEWFAKVANGLVDAMNAHAERKAAAAGNSEPTSS